MNLLEKTVYFSIFMQLLTGIIQFDGMFIKLPEEHAVLSDVLKLETGVQFIEAFFYIWLISNLLSFKNVKTMASKRYYDWVLTTPAMLLATIVYMRYLQQQQEPHPNTKPIDFWKFLDTDRDKIALIFGSNFLMLLMGYLGEIGKMAMKTSVTVGMIFFIYSFYVIWENYAKHTAKGTELFTFLFFIWGLYAVAALMNPVNKNIGYNILDIISKNFYGLYIYFVIKSI